MKGVMIEIGKLIALSLFTGLLIIAVISFVATPAIITRQAIENSPHLLYICLQAGILIAVIGYVVQTILKVITDHD